MTRLAQDHAPPGRAGLLSACSPAELGVRTGAGRRTQDFPSRPLPGRPSGTPETGQLSTKAFEILKKKGF